MRKSHEKYEEQLTEFRQLATEKDQQLKALQTEHEQQHEDLISLKRTMEHREKAQRAIESTLTDKDAEVEMIAALAQDPSPAGRS